MVCILRIVSSENTLLGDCSRKQVLAVPAMLNLREVWEIVEDNVEIGMESSRRHEGNQGVPFTQADVPFCFFPLVDVLIKTRLEGK